MKSTVGVVKLEVSYSGSILLHMDGILRHCPSPCAEDRWLIHIVPVSVDARALSKLLVIEKVAPVVLSVLVEEVDPGGVAGPALANERV